MVGAQDAFAVGQVLFEQRDGLFESIRVLVGAGEVVADDEGVGVVGAQDAQGFGEVLFE